MQLHHLRYIVEVERAGSISKAAENLHLSQPHLSTAISELEKELAIKIFRRTNRGVLVTDEGMVFLNYAHAIVNQVANLERMYQQNKKGSISLRFAWSIQTAHVPLEFLNSLPPGSPINIHLMEGSHLDVLKALIAKDVDIGVIFIPEESCGEYKRYAASQNLVMKKMWTMESCIYLSAHSRLAEEEIIHKHMLTDDYIQLVYRPAGIFDLPNSTAPTARGVRLMDRNIYFNDRATMVEILSSCPNTYVFGAYVDPRRMERHNLVARPHTVYDTKFAKAILHHKKPLNKEMARILQYLEEMTDTTHPMWGKQSEP